ncbi:HMGL-like-domain-containing protein [Mycena galericulata]|nr:HMGL-like-domain-containing protein [Mycena galericulata]
MPSSTRRPKSASPRRWMRSASSTLSSRPPSRLSCPAPIARPYASSPCVLKSSRTSGATWTIARVAVETGAFTSTSCSSSEPIIHLHSTRCVPGVDGVNVVMGTSFLREFSHGKDMAYITQSALGVITFVKSKNIEIRFSDDSFRSDLVDLLSIYQAVDRIGVHRVGIADTVGCANPRQVYELVRMLRGVVRCDIEVHLHNDTGMAIANAYTALEAGATHIDTSVLGIGERNGITPLGGLIACLYAAHRDVVKRKYNLPLLRELEELVACAVEVGIPFMNPITAFTHKAGVYDKFQGVVADPAAQVFSPTDFGLVRPGSEVVPFVGAAA